ncbi:hypothetical protein M422DRAFT_166335 [Sphaerobolus stellatus SS14]|uniref:Copper transport protein n=1 Tax=Sphaerobolus stellatus (strain SS14) TaxID=990650 RepID=A0A0C9VSN5_SPHS4|nr:hypothetical protein M422DRAFT_166335 [Sphaerobolus stellatus SS14]
MGGSMMPWLHFTLGDNLYFNSWVPLSAGAVVGACIGLFMLGIIERWLAAMRCAMEAYWARRSVDNLCATCSDIESLEADQPAPEPTRITVTALRRSAPFIPAHELTRGAMYACQSVLGYTLMLAVMTFHAGYIIAIILGLGVGEVLFGRFGALAHAH